RTLLPSIGWPARTWRLISNPATPVTIGAAQLVPLCLTVPPPGSAPRMLSPGANTPRPTYGPPKLLNRNGTPWSVIAPTTRTPGTPAGTHQQSPSSLPAGATMRMLLSTQRRSALSTSGCAFPDNVG